jgi:hypothetical protein
MTHMKDEALKLALEALERCTTWHLTREQFDKNITAIKVIKLALAAPVQERNFCERCGKRLGSGIHTCTPPAAQRTWIGLTDDEIESALPGYREIDALNIYCAIEAKLKEKNT